MLTGKHISEFTDKLIGSFATATVNNILIVLEMGFDYAEEEYNIKCPKISLLKALKKNKFSQSLFFVFCDADF